MLIALFCTGASLYAQSSEKDKATIKWIDSSNKKSDHAIMSKDTVTLLGLYAKDFLFTHSGGNIDTKDSWIKSIKKQISIIRHVHMIQCKQSCIAM